MLNSITGNSRRLQKKGTPREKPISSGGSPMGVRQPPMLATRKMKKMTMCALYLRHSLARSSGRMSSMAEPVVPIQLESSVPTTSMRTLLRVVPAMRPFTAMPPVTTNRPKSSTINGM